jgi:hypothetical protein
MGKEKRTILLLSLPDLRRNRFVVLHEQPPIAVDDEGNPPRMVRRLDPKMVVEPVIRRRAVDVCGSFSPSARRK